MSLICSQPTQYRLASKGAERVYRRPGTTYPDHSHTLTRPHAFTQRRLRLYLVAEVTEFSSIATTEAKMMERSPILLTSHQVMIAVRPAERLYLLRLAGAISKTSENTF